MSKPYILIAEDDVTSQQILKKILSTNYEVGITNNGKECLISIKDRIPDLLLLDISMPSINGYTVCETLRSNPMYDDLKIIAATSHSRVEDKNLALKLGADDYITKPYQADLIQQLITKYAPLESTFS